ncbi:MAG: translation initiation factor IF-3 [Patescibacteria group bacterium]
MRRTYRRRVILPVGPAYKVNREITAPEVRLVDEKGQNVGVVATAEARAMAEKAGYDLVEVSPTAKPPVAKILDFSQFKYQRDKETQKAKQKQKKQETKGIRLSTRIGTHDLELRLNQASKFLDDGSKLKIELLLRGREHQHRELAEATINQFIDGLKKRYTITIEQPVLKVGARMSLICFSSGKVAAPQPAKT